MKFRGLVRQCYEHLGLKHPSKFFQEVVDRNSQLMYSNHLDPAERFRGTGCTTNGSFRFCGVQGFWVESVLW